MITDKAKHVAFLNSGGVMGELIRAKDWTNSLIGPPESWPQSLRTAVNILLNSQFPMFIWWGRHLITIYNDAYCSIAGEKHPSLLGRPGQDAWAEIWDDLSPLVNSVFNGQSTWSEDQKLLLNRRGYVEETYFTFSYSPVWNENGTVEGLFCACIETTEKVMATRRMEESERNLRATILQSPVAMCILRGANYVLEIANQRMYELWGRGSNELLGRPLFEGLPEARNQGLEEPLQSVLTTGESFTAYERPVLLPRDGKIEMVYVNFVYHPFRDGDGTVSGVIAVAIDVTSQVIARKKIEESEQKFRSLVEQAPVAISVIQGNDYVMELVNSSMEEILQKPAADLLQRPVFETMPETRHQGFEQLLQHVYRTGERVTANEYPLQLKRNGEMANRYVNFVYEPIKEVNGTVSGVMTVAIDVTEQVTARRRIEESSEELQLAIAVADLGTFRIDLYSGRGDYSQQVMEWFGLDRQGITIDEFISFIHEDDRAVVAAVLERSYRNEDNGRHDLTYRVVHPRERVLRYLRSSGRTYFADDGKPYLLIGMIQDITAQVQYQKRLIESEAELQKRVAERTLELQNLNNELQRTNANLEEFAYAASHDMKEPIRKIHLFCDRLKGELNEKLTENQRHLFSRVENASRRMNTLIEDLLTYSTISKGVSNLEEVDLQQKIKKVLEDLEVEIEEKNAKILVGPLPVITGHRRQMQQLFQNLISNALKYSKPGQTPQIELCSRIVDGSEVALPLLQQDAQKQYHLIEVKDNGIGFEQEDAERIFHVFTRLHGNAEYKGTGVGLSIVKKVAENHQGFCWAEGKPGEGATFSILLPVMR
jgi:PAS domain S-box-containing protein